MDAKLLSAAMNISITTAERWWPHLEATMMEYGIMSPLRMAAFLAQIGQESGGLQYTTEIWGPTPIQAKYEGRADLGNIKPGDGSRFRGHGLIQVTGRHNTARVRDRLRARLGSRVPDFESDPNKLAEPEWAAYSAGDYWDDHDLNTLADKGDMEIITRKINGGLTHFAERMARYKIAKKELNA